MFGDTYKSSLSLLLGGATAVILLVYLRRKRGKGRPIPKPSADTTFWICRHCGHKNKEKRTHCAKCREEAPGDVPEAIGKYKVLKLIHYSVFVDIFLGHDENDPATWDNLVVIKRVKQAYSTLYKEQMRNEARILSLLKCAYAPRFVEWDHEKEEYLVMEYLAGRSLDRIGKLGRNELIDMTLELTDAIESIQMQGICHRDLKPGNVMVGDRVALIDFSIAGIIGEKGKDKCIPTGTPFYSPPESDRGICNPENDIYGLGATIFYMSTGNRPGLDTKIDLPGEKAVLIELIQKCMKSKPSERPFVDDVRKAISQLEQRPRIFAQGKTHFLREDTTTIGTSKDADIHIHDENNCIDGIHAMIRKNDGDWIIVDNESRTGTYLKSGDEFAAIKERILSDGSYVSLGFRSLKGPHIALRFRGRA